MEITTPRQVGKLLRGGRQKARWTQAALALRLRVSRKWVSEAEAGSPGTTIGPLLRALNTVGVTLTVAREQASRGKGSVFIADVDAIIEAAREPARMDAPKKGGRKGAHSR